MKSIIRKFAVGILVFALGFSLVSGGAAYADDSENTTGTSISISPVSKILQLVANSTYDDVFKITNNGNSPMNFEVYAAPYAYNYSEEEDAYKLGFNKENTYTQIVRWITFQDTNGNYVEKANFTADPNSSVEVSYRISTPASIPAGGQYAVLFAHTLSSVDSSSGIKTEASPGLVVYGRAEGETNISGEITALSIKNNLIVDNSEKTIINGTAKVKNTGNVDFMASGKLKVTGIFGQIYYETPGNSTKSRVSIIPETELSVSDSWDDTPFFGIFNVEWTVTAGASESETITKFIIIMPPALIILAILLLTIVIVWIIIMVRRRKERRSKFMA
ncbi:hypothetical protein J6S55_03305 [Candidatus Saccharibacteria bacterium]|nr:hypothetical protein [Candidatus Saccharibacteria bacterium]